MLTEMMSGYCFWTRHNWSPWRIVEGVSMTPNELGGYDAQKLTKSRRECIKCTKVEERDEQRYGPVVRGTTQSISFTGTPADLQVMVKTL